MRVLDEPLIPPSRRFHQAPPPTSLTSCHGVLLPRHDLTFNDRVMEERHVYHVWSPIGARTEAINKERGRGRGFALIDIRGHLGSSEGDAFKPRRWSRRPF